MSNQENPTSTLRARFITKHDTEENWNQPTASNFVPRKGELIIFDPDNTHPYPRLKVGNDNNTVTELGFIDAGTVLGRTVIDQVQIYDRIDHFPGNLNAQPNTIYIARDTGQMYYWDNSLQEPEYKSLGAKYQTSASSIITLTGSPTFGTPTITSVSDHTFMVIHGNSPSVTTQTINVITSITNQGGNN